ncbi:hypothetical protein [Sphingomonas aquatica]|uniref:hypothetical protein n=1 Tax=Sphingomonas aquatica TaxID=1763824 RepID=UPI00301DAB73
MGHAPPHAIISIYTRNYTTSADANLTCAFLLLGHDVGHLGAILGGLAAGIATLLIGQGLIAFIRSPMIRVGIACLFAIPAGFAGFQAAHALGSLATDNSMLLAILGSIAAMATTPHPTPTIRCSKSGRAIGRYVTPRTSQTY